MQPNTHWLADYEPQLEFEESLSESDFPFGTTPGILSESEELELAAEFLELSDEGEFEEFLGGSIFSALKKAADSSVGQAIGRIVKNVAHTALPAAATAFATSIGGPLAGVAAGKLTQGLEDAIGLEMEGMSREDRELEIARRFIRFAVHAIANAFEGDDPHADPEEIAHQAAVEAARDFAPGLIISAAPSEGSSKRRAPGSVVTTGSFPPEYPRQTSSSLRTGDNMNHDIDHTEAGFNREEEYATGHRRRPVLNEEEHMSLVSDLMKVNDQKELGMFLRGAIHSITNAVGQISPRAARALEVELANAARHLLPPSGASEAESPEMEEERDWETANTMVKLATESVERLAAMPQDGDPNRVAKHVVVKAAGVHAPHLVPLLRGEHNGKPHCGCQQHHHHGQSRPSGHWYRQGDRIVLEGI